MGATKDTHPDAHACRLKLSAALAHAPMDMPWNLSLEMAHYVQKFAAVSAACQLTREEELQILQITICDPDDPAHLKTPGGVAPQSAARAPQCRSAIAPAH